MLRLSGKAILLTLALSVSSGGSTSLAQEILSPRLQIGVSILPAVIAANKRLAGEGADSLPIYLVYRNNRYLAEKLRPAIEKTGQIRKRGLQVESLSLDALLDSDPAPTSTIFIVESMGDELGQLLEFARSKRVLVFSPLKGDVELGVPTGFRVTDKVLPMVNMSSLKQSNIQLKAFFLRVAVKYE